MFLAVALTILGLGFLCWILFSLAVYALPFFAAVTAGVWAYGTGAGVIGAVAVGLVAGVATLVAGQVLFAVVRSTLIRAALALAFAAPAAVAGYHAVLGVVAIGDLAAGVRRRRRRDRRVHGGRPPDRLRRRSGRIAPVVA
jgi:hypothetical protein